MICEGPNILCGYFEKEYIWILSGTCLLRISILLNTHEIVANIPDAFIENGKTDFVMSKRSDTIFIFSKRTGEICIFDLLQQTVETISCNMQGTKKGYAIVNGPRNFWLIPIYEAKLFVCDDKGLIKEAEEFRSSLLNKLYDAGLEFLHIVGKSGVYFKGMVALLIRTNKNDCVCLINEETYEITDFWALDNYEGFCYRTVLDDKHLWTCLQQDSSSFVISADVQSRKICRKIKLSASLGKNVHLRNIKNSICLISEEGNIGLIEEVSDEIRIVANDSGMLLCADGYEQNDNVLLKKDNTIVLINLHRLEQVFSYVVPVVPNLRSFIPAICS